MNDTERHELMVKENLDYRTCFVSHQQFEQELSHLQTRQHLTEAEQLRVRELKKLKLTMKDRMAVIRAQTSRAGVGR